jgi:hypothetical protein
LEVTVTQTELLIASLTALDSRGIYFDDEQYMDWSSTEEDEDGNTITRFEVGDDTDSAVLRLDREQLLALQQRLTAHLLSTR